MKIEIQLFASLKDIVGSNRFIVDVPPDSSVQDLFEKLVNQFPLVEPYRKSILFALNEKYVQSITIIKEGDQVAMLPPVSGG